MAKTTKKTVVPRKRRGGRKKVTEVVKAYVAKAIHSQIENKSIQYNAGINLTNYADGATMNGFPLTPGLTMNIIQGVGAADRTGNRIKIMKAVLNYWMVPTAYNVLINPNPKPLMIRIFIGYSKINPTIIPPAADTALFFQNGDAASAPNGFIADILRKVNKDKYVIFRDIKHKLGYEAATGTGAVAGSQYYGNNDFKYNILKKIDVTKYMPKTVIYNDTTSVPTSRGLFCWIQIVNADNTATTGYLPVAFNYFVDLTYEDA